MNYYITPDYAPSPNGCYLFEKEADIKNGGTATVSIYASSRYILFINDEYICEGPCRGHEKLRYFDKVNVNLKAGKNKICVKVMHVTDYLSSVYNTALPELVFEAVCGTEVISSDLSWSISYLAGCEYETYAMKTVGPYEHIDATKKNIALECKTAYQYECIFNENGRYDRVGAARGYVLEKRPIPMLYPQDEFCLKPIKTGDGFIDYDAGEYVTAKLKFIISKNSNVKITYSECYELENGKGKRDDTSGELKGFYDTVKTGDEDFVFEPFWFRPFRFIRIEGDIDAVKKITARRINYPFLIDAEFECSDEQFNKMHDISMNTIRCCCHEIVVDCPYYEQQQYELDSFVQLSVISRMTQDRQLHKKVITDFSLAQTENGLLTSIYPSTIVQIIPSYSLFWIMMVKNYLENTQDTEFVAKFVGNIDKVLTYYDSVVKKYGIVKCSPYWDFVDWVSGWKYGDVPITEEDGHTIYSLYYAKALKDASYICSKLERFGLLKEYEERHKALSKTINKLCFDAQRGLYKNGTITKNFSMHTIVWSILSDVAPKNMWDSLIDHLDDDDVSKCSFSMNFFTFRALEKAGRYEKAFSLFGGWRKMVDLNCTTWCENPDSPRSECHGWSSAPLYEFSANILGVKLSDDEIIIRPTVGHLKYAKGCVPTKFGKVFVDWTSKDDGFSVKVSAPDGVLKTLVLPNGDVHTFKDKSFEF